MTGDTSRVRRLRAGAAGEPAAHSFVAEPLHVPAVPPRVRPHGGDAVDGATGVCRDNSPSEAFFATLKRELVHRYTWDTRKVVRHAVVRWIEGWYNPRRLHSSISYLTPIEKEDSYQQISRAA